MGKREILASRLTEKFPKFCGLTERLPNQWANILGTQNFRFLIDTTNSHHSYSLSLVIVHLFPPNLGGSARILDKVHHILAVRHIPITAKLKQGV